jgi:hypothetical protein
MVTLTNPLSRFSTIDASMAQIDSELSEEGDAAQKTNDSVRSGYSCDPNSQRARHGILYSQRSLARQVTLLTGCHSTFPINSAISCYQKYDTRIPRCQKSYCQKGC